MSQGSPDPPPKSRRRLRFSVTEDNFPFLVVALVLCGIALVVPAQSDTFYHLRSGKAMWESRWFLQRELFSHTAFGHPLANHWWLSQLLFYALYSTGGPVLLSAFAGACSLFALVISWSLVRGSFEVRAIVGLIYVLVFPQWSVRPQVLSMVMLMLGVRLLLADRMRWLPLLLLVWANMHALVVLGLVLPGAAVLDSLLWSRRRLRLTVTVFVACAAAPMVSPLGLHYWPRVWQTVVSSRQLGIHEYRSAMAAGWDATALSLTVVAFCALIVRGRATFRRFTSGERALTIVAGVFAVAALMSLRNAAFFVLVAVPAMSWLLGDEVLRRPPRVIARPAWVLVGIAAVCMSVLSIYRWRDGGVQVGWRPIRAEAVAAIRACQGPLYNDFDDGGVLMWFVPEKPVFVDGRVEAYPAGFLDRAAQVSRTGDYQQMFAQYGIRCAAVAPASPMHVALRSERSFHVTYADSQWVVFER